MLVYSVILVLVILGILTCTFLNFCSFDLLIIVLILSYSTYKYSYLLTSVVQVCLDR